MSESESKYFLQKTAIKDTIWNLYLNLYFYLNL